MTAPPDQQRILEALLFAASAPLSEAELAERLGIETDIAGLLHELAGSYAERGINLVRLAGGWTFRTAPDLASFLVSERPVSRKLSRAAVETLAIIAYHQPVTRAEIEAIRGGRWRGTPTGCWRLAGCGRGAPRRPAGRSAGRRPRFSSRILGSTIWRNCPGRRIARRWSARSWSGRPERDGVKLSRGAGTGEEGNERRR
jgi:hypothetical protein